MEKNKSTGQVLSHCKTLLCYLHLASFFSSYFVNSFSEIKFIANPKKTTYQIVRQDKYDIPFRRSCMDSRNKDDPLLNFR